MCCSVKVSALVFNEVYEVTASSLSPGRETKFMLQTHFNKPGSSGIQLLSLGMSAFACPWGDPGVSRAHSALAGLVLMFCPTHAWCWQALSTSRHSLDAWLRNAPCSGWHKDWCSAQLASRDRSWHLPFILLVPGSAGKLLYTVFCTEEPIHCCNLNYALWLIYICIFIL